MFPTSEDALKEIETASRLNPGAWTQHSRNVAAAAKIIADCCPDLCGDKAFVLGLLHDIGRRNGVSALRHTIDGYNYAVEKGWDDVARVCLTHSFPVKDIEADIGKKDITIKEYEFLKKYLESIEYDDYDKLIILCDALADADGFCILEKRFVDTARRYGVFPFSVDRWNKTYEYKTYFEELIGQSVYRLLPGIEKCIFC